MKVDEEAKNFFANRRSVSAKRLKGPGPGLKEIQEIIGSAMRVPDHGKLEPWRISLILEKSKNHFIDIIEKRGKELSVEPEKLKKNKQNVINAPLIVTIICSPVENSKIPKIEQVLSTGALCLNVLNNFLVYGWGANWLTGWMAHDRQFGKEAFDLLDNEFVAGLIYVGNFDEIISDRPRPKLEDKVIWFQ